MGASGAGKTTLLDILAKRNKSGHADGSITINGIPIKQHPSFKRISGYVFQDDKLLYELTVKESLMFSADLRLPLPAVEKEEIVNRVMKDLRIDHIASSKVGRISGGERRRVSVGMELVVEPYLLYLDEATSGLDAASSLHLINMLRKLVDEKGRTVIISIHQPSQQLFMKFDHVILLNKGVVIYDGPPSKTLEYFKNLQFIPSEGVNPADFIIESAIEENLKPNPRLLRFDPQLLVSHELNQQQSLSNLEEDAQDSSEKSTTQLNTVPKDTMSLFDNQPMMNFATSFYFQFYVLCKRAFKVFIRNLTLFPAHLIAAIILGLGLGIVFFKLPYDLFGSQNRTGAIFFIQFLIAFGAMSSLEFCKCGLLLLFWIPNFRHSYR